MNCKRQRAYSVTRQTGINLLSPSINPTGNALHVSETLLSHPHCDVKTANPVVTKNHDLLVAVRFQLPNTNGKVAHRQQLSLRDMDEVVFALFPAVEK